jgi:hypothetical protein
MSIRVRNLPEGSGPGAIAEHPAELRGSAADPETVAVTEGGAWEVAGATRLRAANTGKNAGKTNRAAAEAARGISIATPGRVTAAATTAIKEETARTGIGIPTGGMVTAEAAAAADMVAAMAATVADRLPAMAAAPAVGVDAADVAAATKRQGPMCPPDRMQECATYIAISH